MSGADILAKRLEKLTLAPVRYCRETVDLSEMYESEFSVLTKFLTVLLHKSQDNEEVYALYWQDLLDQFSQPKIP